MLRVIKWSSNASISYFLFEFTPSNTLIMISFTLSSTSLWWCSITIFIISITYSNRRRSWFYGHISLWSSFFILVFSIKINNNIGVFISWIIIILFSLNSIISINTASSSSIWTIWFNRAYIIFPSQFLNFRILWFLLIILCWL